LQFGPKQRNETAAYTLLALLDLQPDAAWADAQAPLRGITPIIDFIATAYGNRYAPNTRETIRDDAVKFFVEEGLLLRNPDDPNRPTNSGKTVYQIEPTALALFRKFGTLEWTRLEALPRQPRNAQARDCPKARPRPRARHLARWLPGRALTRRPESAHQGHHRTLLPRLRPRRRGPLHRRHGKQIRPSGNRGLGRARRHLGFRRQDSRCHRPRRARNWLLLIEAVTSAGPVDGKRRKELKDLFAGCKAGLVFVTAFETRRTMQTFVSHIAWESEVWIAEDPDHMIHFNGERFLGPYPDVMP
jgi:hypothetical protein